MLILVKNMFKFLYYRCIVYVVLFSNNINFELKLYYNILEVLILF